MPNENAGSCSSTGERKKSKSMAFLIAAIIIGIILIFVFNSNGIPFGRSLNRHPPQLIGLIIIVAATFGLVILCVRCLVLSSNNTPLASTTTTYTFRTFNQQPNVTTWQAVYPTQSGVPISAILTQPSMMNAGFGPYNQSAPRIPSGQTQVQQQLATPQTPPPDFELPPSYAEATKELPVIK